MRRRNSSLTESLEPRLVLSVVSPRGSVDPPSDNASDSKQREDVAVTTQESEPATSQRQTPASNQTFTPIADDPIVTPVDSPDSATNYGSSDMSSDGDRDSVDESKVRSLSSDGGSVDDDLAGDSLSTDDRTSVLVDSVSDVDGTRADEESDADVTIEASDAGIGLSSESPPGESSNTRVSIGDQPGNILINNTEILLNRDAGTSSVLTAATSDLPDTSIPISIEPESWLGSLTESVKSWLNLDALGVTTGGLIAESSVPYVALAGGFSLVAVGRKGQIESESLEASESGIGVWKTERRSGRVTDRRRFRWFGFATKDRRHRPSGEVRHVEPSEKPDLAEPDISEAFAMSLMQPVGQDAFMLSPMTANDDSGEETDDQSLSVELVAAGAATVAGGTIARRVRSGRKQGRSRPTLDYLGTTLPR